MKTIKWNCLNTACFYHKVLLAYSPVHALYTVTAAFLLQPIALSGFNRAMWPTRPKIFTIKPPFTDSLPTPDTKYQCIRHPMAILIVINLNMIAKSNYKFF